MIYKYIFISYFIMEFYESCMKYNIKKYGEKIFLSFLK